MTASSMLRSTRKTRNMKVTYHSINTILGIPDGKTDPRLEGESSTYHTKSPIKHVIPKLILDVMDENSCISLPNRICPMIVNGRNIVVNIMPKWIKSSPAILNVSVTTLSRAFALKDLKNFTTTNNVLSAIVICTTK
mmetsp:Transcript_32327/g.50351  ORF Transcript_32327/g.50351 Transcript_32327/m.50351 type:complete len:137 (+) Transcript_32327:1102-1512(+)